MPATIYSHTFPNGLTLIGEPVESRDSAAFNLLIPAGCSLDPVGKFGLANFTCEMTLRGAGSRDNRALVEALDGLGVERGESVGVTQTVFSAACVAEQLHDALAVYADIVRRPHLPGDQLEAGRQVCLQEVRGMEDEPAQKVIEVVRRQHYPAPWGRASHGNVEGIEAVTAADIQRFSAQRYRPDHAILAVAGRFDWDRTLEHVQSLLGDWHVDPMAKEREEDPPPPITHIPLDSSQCHLGLAFNTVPYKHADYFQAWAAVGVLSGGSSSRLFTEVREKRGLCYTVSASLQSQVDRAAVFCHAGTSAERAQETLDVTCQELVRLAEGVTKEELDRLKARVKSSLIMQQESTSSRAASLARDWKHLGRARSLEEVAVAFDAVTAESINAFLKALPPRDFTIVTLGPQPLEAPRGVS
ncbi:Peptidase M16 inactive domain protein [Pirellulimonas nuda]|uniref:Peptidase M16 inactive domain protein n=1 Tax=Pirellulimonas nuda TaxID=2528009 RepID=A0A518DEM5_9BACT|nr:pitrilysin family protein [Pirellulimonas nuda]QDU89930.1 Peptidase M16 inactive domain protein [Pirellulimonas nuda]